MSAKDDYKIALNILARVGINSPDFVKEYAKAKATLHAFDSMDMLQGQMMPQNSPNNAISAPPTDQAGQSTTQEPLGAQNAINQPNQPNSMEGQGALNLP